MNDSTNAPRPPFKFPFLFVRVVFGFALLVAGLGFCFLNIVANGFVRDRDLVYYHVQLNNFPVKQSYSQGEMTTAAWQIWTNRLSLPDQPEYTVGDIKSSLSKTLPLATDQDTADRAAFILMVKKLTDYPPPLDFGAAAFGVLLIAVGAFLMGTGAFRNSG